MYKRQDPGLHPRVTAGRRPRQTARLSPGGADGQSHDAAAAKSRSSRAAARVTSTTASSLVATASYPSKAAARSRFRFRRRPASPVRRSRRTRSTVAGAMLGQRSADLRLSPPLPERETCGDHALRGAAARRRRDPPEGCSPAAVASTATGRPRPVTSKYVRMDRERHRRHHQHEHDVVPLDR